MSYERAEKKTNVCKQLLGKVISYFYSTSYVVSQKFTILNSFNDMSSMKFITLNWAFIKLSRDITFSFAAILSTCNNKMQLNFNIITTTNFTNSFVSFNSIFLHLPVSMQNICEDIMNFAINCLYILFVKKTQGALIF